MEDFNNKRRNGTSVYAADYRDPDGFKYYFDQMSAEVGSAELSLREVMDELYSLIADISNSCSNPMTEPFELPDDNHYGYDKQHKDKKETINAYHKELIIICSKLPGFLSKLYNVYQTITEVHGEVAWTFLGGEETIPAENYDHTKESFKMDIKNATSPYQRGECKQMPL